METNGYDIIGDIHGQAEALKDLLRRLGYAPERGAWRHPERRALFLGDYIDRGPAIRETLQIVRGMVEAGAAIALCGNHELGALQYDTPDGQGGWLRPHTPRMGHMGKATRAQFAGRETEWADWLRWMQTLPLTYENAGFRAVHACWDAGWVATLAGRRLDNALLRVTRTEDPQGRAVKLLLCGREIDLPPGYEQTGDTGFVYREIRVRWWLDGRGRTYREACINHTPGPDVPIAAEHNAQLLPPDPADPRPIFFGHYWLPPLRPAPLGPKLACLDYSVARGGPLVAYRWDGEAVLDAAKFVFDPARLTAPALATVC